MHINIFTSFLAGVFMFLAPCTLPLVPGFIAFISHDDKRLVVKKSLLFCLGFLLTFMVFGLLAGLLGHILAPAKAVIQKIGAIFVIILGLYTLGIFHLSFFKGQLLGENFRHIFKGKFSPFIFGISIACGWTPCVGPVLAGIFFYATFSYSVFAALWLFLFFSLGFIVPFIGIAYIIKRSKKEVKLTSKSWFSILAGVLLVFIGLLLLTDNFSLLATWAYELPKFINFNFIYKFL